MDRLTIDAYDVIGSYVPKEMCSIGRDGMVDDFDGCPDYCFDSVDSSCEECAIQKCFNLLGEYEDTGLTPEQILEMDGMYKELSREVMAYRKVGTVVEVKSMGRYSRLAKKHGTIGQAIDECAEYEAIGTVEECREAVEKQKLKKPVKDEYCHECCPSCGWIVCKGEYGGRYLPHCENCGQAIDWRDSDV